MFLKLLKYEFKSVGKWYLGLFALTAVLALVIASWMGFNKVTVIDAIISSSNADIGYELEPGPAFSMPLFLLGWLWTAFIVLFFSLIISTIVIIVRRFKSNIFGRQGYLTMTLPVSTHAIILSKLVSSLIWIFLAFFTFVVVSLSFLFLIANVFNSIPNFLIEDSLSDFFAFFLRWDFILFLFIAVLLYTSSILMIYLAIAIAHLFENRRTLYAFLIFFGILFIRSSISNFLQNLLNLSDPYYYLNYVYDLYIIAYNLVICAGSYWGIYYIIKNKLNIL